MYLNINAMKTKFVIEQETPEFVYILDTTQSEKSVTNDAKAVVEYLYEHHNLGNRRLFYRDTIGNNDEMLHENGTFKGFAVGNMADLPTSKRKYR